MQWGGEGEVMGAGGSATAPRCLEVGQTWPKLAIK